MKKIYMLILLVIGICSIYAQLTFTKQPVGNQLYTRDLATNKAIVKFEGTVPSTSNYTSLVLETYRNNVLYNSTTQNLVYNAGVAVFNFQQPIVAEKLNYSFRITNQSNTTLYSVFNIVAGDAYVVQGQSNVGMGSGSPFPATNQFIRTYNPSPTTNWMVANMYLGGIAYHFADGLTTSQNIPIAILNGSQGGQNIEFFQRNDANPYDDSTNYGKLLNLYTASELGNIRAFIWYQGEANTVNTNLAQYKSLFHSLYDDWKEDYDFEKLYMYQIKGCLVTKAADIFEALRQLPEEIPNTQIISTNGVDLHSDLCHYPLDGYKKFAQYLHNLSAYEIYNYGSINGAVSPNVGEVKFTNANKNQVEIEIKPISTSLTWQSGVESQFFFSDNTVSVVSGSVVDSKIILNLNKSFTADNPWAGYLGYTSGTTVAQPYLPNQNGIGLLSFKYRPIANYAVLSTEILDKEKQFEMFPNPVTDIVQIKLPLDEKIDSVTFFSVDGKKIIEVKDAKKEINLKSLPKGVYQVKVITKKGEYNKRIIKN